MSDRTKIEIEFGDDLGIISSNVSLTKEQRKAFVDATLDVIKNPANDKNPKDDGADDELDIPKDMLDKPDWKLDMYRALVVHALKGTDDAAMLLTAKKMIKKLDKEFYDENFKHDLADELKQLD